jgi:hypothetical protein
MSDEATNRYATAKGFFQSAIMIHRSPDRFGREIITIQPVCMLVGFSLEIYFKAFLLACEVKSNDVRRFGHKIRNLFEVSLENGLLEAIDCCCSFDAHLRRIIETVGPGHEDFTFRYIEEGATLHYPLNWEKTFSVLDALDWLVDNKVGASVAHGATLRQPNWRYFD